MKNKKLLIIKSEIVSEKSSCSHVDFFFFDWFFFFFRCFSLLLGLGRGGGGFSGLGGAASDAQRSDLLHSGGDNLSFKKPFIGLPRISSFLSRKKPRCSTFRCRFRLPRIITLSLHHRCLSFINFTWGCVSG